MTTKTTLELLDGDGNVTGTATLRDGRIIFSGAAEGLSYMSFVDPLSGGPSTITDGRRYLKIVALTLGNGYIGTRLVDENDDEDADADDTMKSEDESREGWFVWV